VERHAKDDEIKQHQLHEILTAEEIKELEMQVDGKKATVRTAKKNKVVCRDVLQKFKDARGCPVKSVIAQIEKVLAKYGATREAYHGGDFNGVSIHAIVRNIIKIMPELREIIMREKDKSCSDEEATTKLDDFLSVCGLINAASSALLIIDPSEKEILDAERKVKKLMSVWRAQKTIVALKAHIIEHHMIVKMRELGGLGEKSESFIELLHQDGRRNERRLNCVRSYAAKHNSIIKTTKLGIHPEVAKRKDNHREQMNRKPQNKEHASTHPAVTTARAEVKEECNVKRERYLKGEITMDTMEQHQKMKKE
jgi:hypothetical protein